MPTQALSQADFVEPVGFTVRESCKAYTSLRRSTGVTSVGINETYVAYGENKAVAGSHVLIDVRGERKWLSLQCGNYAGARPAFAEQPGNADSNSERGAVCLPFFDTEENYVNVGFGGRVDITPVAPKIEPFGAAVNRLCGEPGKVTEREAFEQLLKAHPDVMAELMAYTNGKVFGSRPVHQKPDDYLRDLAEAWYAVSAFDHIFCGEPKSADSIGGLHYHGRYQQLQVSGEACRLPNYRRNEVVPGSVYTMGVRMKRADGGWAAFATKGYGLTLSAEDMLKIVTRAFAENPTSGNRSKACILDVKDGDTRFKTVFVRRAEGIRTFFPDATPDLVRNTPCSSDIRLPDDSAVTPP